MAEYVVTIQDNRQSCWCCLGFGDNRRGGECQACDGSGVKPDRPPCQPLCRRPKRTLAEAALSPDGIGAQP